MNKGVIRFIGVTALGLGSLYLINKLSEALSTSGEKEEKEDGREEKENEDEFSEDGASEEKQALKEENLVDDTITIESIIHEDPLYNRFSYTQLRAIFYEFYRRAHVWKTDEIAMKILSLEDFVNIFQEIDVDDLEICRTMYYVWDHDGDGCVGIRDFVYTFAHSKLGSDNERLDYIFRTADSTRDGILSYEDVYKNLIYIYRNDPNVDPDAVENIASLHARDVFAELKDELLRGVSHSQFLSAGRFLRNEISLLRLFALAMLKGDVPPGSSDEESD